MAITWNALVVAGIVALTAAIGAGAGPKPGTDAATVVQGSNAFCVDLYARLAGQSGNLFFSPASIHTALAMTYLGAAGRTADEMAAVMRYPLPADKLAGVYGGLIGQLSKAPEVTVMEAVVTPSGGAGFKEVRRPAYDLVVSNALWGQKGYPFKPAYVQQVKESYGAGLNDVDFKNAIQAAKTINDWVARQTRDKIQDLVPPDSITEMTRLVLTNAVYFKSNWEKQFQKSQTQDEPFQVAAERKVDVPMMNRQGHCGYAEADDLQVLELPYIRHALSMIVLLPRKADGLAALEKSLSAEKLEEWLKPLKSVEVRVALPKFKFSSSFGLGEPLKAMGMESAFDAGRADFSGMTSMERVFIAAVLHKSFVAVDEEGTEAAAATAVMMAGTAMPIPEEPKIFRADHPFLFLIRHSATGDILFFGRVSNPKE